MPDGDVQTVGFLKNHLSGDLYTWMRAVAPAGIDAFFTNLKDVAGACSQFKWGPKLSE